MIKTGALGRELDGDAIQSHTGKMRGRIGAMDTYPAVDY